MNSTHIIRIGGPWRRQVVSGADQPLQETVQMPSSWEDDLGDDFRGRVEYRRFFNRPTNIDDSTKILLTFEKVVGHVMVWLNGHDLGKFGWPEISRNFDVSAKLAPRNELIVMIDSVSAEELEQLCSKDQNMPAGGLVGEVRLEIG